MTLPDDLLTELWIGGKAVPASDGGRFDVRDPATGKVLTSVADGSVDDAIAAVDAADAAAAGWAATAPRRRSEVLRRAFELMT
jgi:succinate-semialdehyde dehydrogenase/glutarate-semialdehyde dehydrogenase